MKKLIHFLLLIKICTNIVYTLDNGLAKTPPMGWLAWERFRCNIDCKEEPDECVSDQLFKTMSDIIESDGYKDVGYEYIILDDCWLEKERDFNGKLVADKERFPLGMKHLSDYIHSKGLKFGIYENYGNYTCEKYPGIMGHLEEDANIFAEWDVDYVKIDGCFADSKDMDKGYPDFGYYLNKTGRPMVYSCSWPFYQLQDKLQPNYKFISQHCNLWRNFKDVNDAWSDKYSSHGVDDIIEYYAEHQDELIPNAGPGHWNDPDMLIIGNFGLSYEQSKTQMAIWAILAAPLLMSVDLRTIRPEFKAILQNEKIIQVNQDPLGIQGRRIYNNQKIQYWTRPITPVYESYYSYAIAFRSRRIDGTPTIKYVTLEELGLNFSGGYLCEDLFNGKQYGVLNPESRIKVKINPTGVVMLRCNLNIC